MGGENVSVKEKGKIYDRLTILEVDFSSFKEEVKEDIADIKKGNEILHEMSTNVALLAKDYKNQGKQLDDIECDIKALKNKPIPDISGVVKSVGLLEKDVQELKDKPAKRWDTLVTALITTTIGLIVGFIVGKLLGG